MSLVLWGGCAALTGMVSNIPSLMAIRFVLGVVEAAVMPAMLVFIANWFTKSERSRANTFLILGNPVTVLWMSVVSGYLVNSFGWRNMFIAEGLPAVIWAVIWWFIVQDKPAQAKWLTDQEKQDLDATLRAEQAAIKPVKNYGEAFRSPAVIKLCAQYFLLEHRRVWLRAVAAFDSQERFVVRHGRDGMALGGALSRRNHRDARGFVGVGQARSPEAVRVAVPADRRGGVRGIVLARVDEFLGLVCVAGDRGRCDVCAVRAVFRDRAGIVAEERRRWGDGARSTAWARWGRSSGRMWSGI